MTFTALLTLSTLALAAPGQGQSDTTFAVPPGTRLSLTQVAGDVVVKTWDRNQVRVQATHSDQATLDLQLSGSVLQLRTRPVRGGWVGGARIADYEVTIPASMPVDLQGMNMDVSLEGTRGDVKVNTVEGDVTVRNSAGPVTVSTINGAIEVRGSTGRLELRSTSDDVTVTDARGDVLVDAVSGDIILRGIDARRVEARTVSGDVAFEGMLRADGRYSLLSHSGDVMIALPEGSHATVRTATAAGKVQAKFTLPAAEQPTRHRQVYRLGNGSATIELETFSGDVLLVRPADFPSRRNQED